MIQDIGEHRFSIEWTPREPRPTDYRVIVDDDGNTFVHSADNGGYLPTVAQTPCNPMERYLMSIDDTAYFLESGTAPSGDLEQKNVSYFRTFMPRWRAFGAVTALHLAQWYRANRFCGTCGSAMQPKGDERALVCSKCGKVIYPRINPAVIVAITDGDRIVMTRYANRPVAHWALVAGFAEAGEAFEDTVRREVQEEVGLRVKNIRYFKSQPWAFSSSLLAGFYCDLDGDDTITLDNVELKEGKFFHRSEMEPVDTSISLTSTMIETFRLNQHPK